MKGLALSVPEKHTVVNIQNRKARKHYGMELAVTYDQAAHLGLYRQRIYSSFDDCWKVHVMKWFIERGSDVSEDEPQVFPIRWVSAISLGHIGKVELEIFSDNTSRPANLVKDGKVKILCRLRANLSYIPETQLDRRRGKDGEMYYEANCQVEAVCECQPEPPILANLLTVKLRHVGIYSVRAHL